MGFGEVVGQFAGAADFDAVVEHEDFDAVADEVVAVDEGVDQQLFQDHFGDFEGAEGVEVFSVLRTIQGTFHKIEAALVKLGQCAANVFATVVFFPGDVGSGKPDCGDEKLRDDFFRMFGKKQGAGYVEAVAVGQPEVGEQTGQVSFVKRVLVLYFVELAKLAGVQFVGDGEGQGCFFRVLYMGFAAANEF